MHRRRKSSHWKNFFKKIADSSKKLFKNLEIWFDCFDYSDSDKNKGKILGFIESTFSSNIILDNKTKKNYKYFVIHDDDCEENKEILNSIFDFIKKEILKINENFKINRIYEPNNSFDYFLYYIFEGKLNPSQKEIKKFMKKNEFKKNDNEMWKKLYEKANVSNNKGIDKIKDTLIYIESKKTDKLKTFEIIEEILKYKFY